MKTINPSIALEDLSTQDEAAPLVVIGYNVGVTISASYFGNICKRNCECQQKTPLAHVRFDINTIALPLISLGKNIVFVYFSLILTLLVCGSQIVSISMGEAVQ